MFKKIILFWSFFLISLTAEAFKVSPIELNFSNKGKSVVQTILVENTTDAKVPVEIFAYDRIHIAGKEKRVRTRDFYYFPKQFILKPGEKRNIRVSWMGIRSKQAPKDKKLAMKKGKTSIAQEKAYRLEIKQVPVNLKKNKAKKTGIKFLYNYVASLYVTPPSAKPNFKVLSYRRISPTRVELAVQNVGGAHDIMAQYNLQTQGDNAMVIDMVKQEDDVRGINLLAGEKRKVVFKVPASIGRGNLTF
ncbi:MAG: hypothetical protein ACRBBP_03360, partial [Bdellovibrionales bacterium]